MKHRISILIERWDHTGDSLSPKGWIKDRVDPLTMGDQLEMIDYVTTLKMAQMEPESDPILLIKRAEAFITQLELSNKDHTSDAHEYARTQAADYAVAAHLRIMWGLVGKILRAELRKFG